jgi:hypothetical protein
MEKLVESTFADETFASRRDRPNDLRPFLSVRFDGLAQRCADGREHRWRVVCGQAANDRNVGCTRDNHSNRLDKIEKGCACDGLKVIDEGTPGIRAAQLVVGNRQG